ncbi:MAG: glycosyltransferase family 4 protein [Polyangiaceae bacterium]
MSKVVPTTLAAFAEHPEVHRDGALQVRLLGPAHYIRGQKGNPIARGLVAQILRADVVHFHQQHVLASSLGAIAARASRRKSVVTDLGGGGWDLSGYVSTDRLFAAHLHISEYSRRIFGHAEKSWAHVILGGVDTEKFAPPPIPVEGSDLPTLFVGRLLPHKSVHTVIDAAGSDLPVEIFGTPSHEEYFALLKRKAAGKRVTFRTGSEDDSLIEAYRESLCVVLPSVYETIYGVRSDVPELLGQTLLEGMACGIPAICTNVASMPEIVIDGETGFIVPPDDPKALRERLIWLRENPLERAAMGKRARARIEAHFRWDQVVDRCLRIYGSI